MGIRGTWGLWDWAGAVQWFKLVMLGINRGYLTFGDALVVLRKEIVVNYRVLTKCDLVAIGGSMNCQRHRKNMEKCNERHRIMDSEKL